MKPKIKQFEYSMIQKKDQIMAENLYLQIILSLKSTFDIVLSHEIKLHQNWRHYACNYHLIIVTRLCT